MYQVLEELEPKVVWKYFDDILRIPHPSKNEALLREYVIKFAKEKGLPFEEDSAGNILVRKKAYPGKEAAPGVVLQCHLDMVCEKNSDVSFDFSRDAIVPRIVEGFLYASGTTLGADNGIGVAIALAVLESTDIVHGPLEVLFTVDEETGLTGAFNLKSGWLQSKILINLDSEEDDTITVGCAGGGDSHITLPLKFKKAPNGKCYSCRITGGRGGHSGVDIHLQRANAVKLMARLLWKSMQFLNLGLGSISGGDKHNAIPRECFATVVVRDYKGFLEIFRQESQAIIEEYKLREPDMKIDVVEVHKIEQVLVPDSTRRLLGLLLTLPHGVITMSSDIEGLVETSNNVASVRMDSEKATVLCSTRSSIASALHSTREVLRAAAVLSGADIEMKQPYPGWKPNMNSRLLKTAIEIYAKMFGDKPKIMAIHAGLETGIIGEKYPGMDMISVGPLIQYPHSPDERVKIETVAKFWKFLQELLNNICTGS